MIDTSAIKPHMPVVCSKGGQFAVVDHLEGDASIKLRKDETGQHHFIPTSWVTSVDDKVHVDRSGDRAIREWNTAPVTRQQRSEEASAATDPTHTERVRSQQSSKTDRS